MMAPPLVGLYYYHPDHLGSSTYLTDASGLLYQFYLNLPFGETMAEQHSLTEDYETPYKFNGKELDTDTGYYYYGARYYEPRISIWLSTDPLMEKYPGTNPYVYCLQNPVKFTDPTGMSVEGDDIIKVDQYGYITGIEYAPGPDIVVDENGNQLNFNDSDFDKEQLEHKKSEFVHNPRGDTRLFVPLSNKRFAKMFNDIDIDEIKSKFNSLAVSPVTRGLAFAYLAFAAHGSLDFANDMGNVAYQGGNNPSGGEFPPDGTGGFIKFQDSNTLYNIYDAGNFTTGKAFNLIGVDLNSLLKGADFSSKRTGHGSDSKADQAAITKGYNYNGVRWKK